MNIYAWENHFEDYTCGLAVVIAPDIETARKLLAVQVGYDHDDIKEEPKVYDLSEPRAFFVYGGS